MSLTTETEDLSRLSQLLQAIIDIVPTWTEGQIGFETVGDLLTDTVLTGGLADGRLVRVLAAGGFDLVKVSSGTVHYTAASGAQFRVRMDRTSPRFFGAAGDGVTNDKAALDLADASDAVEIDLGGLSYRYVGTWAATKPVMNGAVIDDGGTISYGLLTDRDVATSAEAAAELTAQTQVKLANLQAVADMISAALAGSSQTVQGRLVAIASTSGTRVGGTWTRRDLTALEVNTITGASMASSQVVLPAGRYRLRADAQFYGDPIVRLRLRNVTGSETLVTSVDFGAANEIVEVASVATDVVFDAPTTIELQYLAAVGRANDGLGDPSATTPPRYAVLDAVKLG